MGENDQTRLIPLPDVKRDPLRDLPHLTLIKKIGEGGMAKVYLCRSSQQNNTEIVVKILRSEHGHDPGIVADFLDEARYSALMSSPYIVRALDAGHVGETYFIELEYLAGVTAEQMLRYCKQERQPLPIVVAIAVIYDVLLALEVVHNAKGPDHRPLGLVHRDVTPSNLIVCRDGMTKLVDFGIAKATHSKEEKTSFGILKGKPSYVAPEQIKQEPLDGRTDLFSLGVSAYELLSGAHPFRDSNLVRGLQRIRTGACKPLTDLRQDLPAPLVAFIAKLMATDRQNRFPDSHAARSELERMDGFPEDLRDRNAQVAAFVSRVTRGGADGIAALAKMVLGLDESSVDAEEEADKPLVTMIRRLVDIRPPRDATIPDPDVAPKRPQRRLAARVLKISAWSSATLVLVLTVWLLTVEPPLLDLSEGFANAQALFSQQAMDAKKQVDRATEEARGHAAVLLRNAAEQVAPASQPASAPTAASLPVSATSQIEKETLPKKKKNRKTTRHPRRGH